MTRTVVKAEEVHKLFYKMYFDDSAERSPTNLPVPVLKAETLAGRKAAAMAELLGQFERSSSVEVLGMKSSEFAGLPDQKEALHKMFDENDTILQYFSQFPMGFIDCILSCGEYRDPAADKPALKSLAPDEQTIYQDGNNDTFWDISYSIRLLEPTKVGGDYPEAKDLFLPLTLRFKFTDDGPQLHSLITDSPAFADLFTLDWTDRYDVFVQQVVSIARERNNELAYRVDLKEIMKLKPSDDDDHYFVKETQAYDGCFAALENTLKKPQFFEQTKLLITDESLAAFGGRTDSAIAQDYNRNSPVIFGKPYVELDKKDLTWSNIKKGITPPASVDSKTWFAELDRRMFRYSQQPAYLMVRPFAAMQGDENFSLKTDNVSYSFYFKDRKYLYDVMMDVLRFEETTFADSTIHRAIHEVPGKIKLTFEMTAEQGTKLMHAQFSNKVLRDHFLGQPLSAKDFIEKCQTAEEEQKRAEEEQKRAEAEQKRAEAEQKRAEAEQKRAEAEQYAKVLSKTAQTKLLKDLSTLKFQLEGAIEEVWGEEGEIKEEVALAKIDMKIDEILYSKDVFDAHQTFLKGSENPQIKKAVTVRVCQAKVQRALNSLPSFETENREQGSIETTQADENPLHTGGGEAIRTGSIVEIPHDRIDTVNSLETRLKDVLVENQENINTTRRLLDEEKRQSILYPTASVAVPEQSPAAAQVRQAKGINESLLRRVVSGENSLMQCTVAGLKNIATQKQASISAIKKIQCEVLAYLTQHKRKFVNKVRKACKEDGCPDPSDDQLIKKIISGTVKPSRWSRKSVNTAILGLKLIDKFENTPELIDNPEMLELHIDALVQKRDNERNLFERFRRGGISRLSTALKGSNEDEYVLVNSDESQATYMFSSGHEQEFKALWGSDYRFVEQKRGRPYYAAVNHSNGAHQADPVASVKKPFRQWYLKALENETVFADDEEGRKMKELSGLVGAVTSKLVLLLEDEAPTLTQENYGKVHDQIDAFKVAKISKEKSPLYHAIAREVKEDLLAWLEEVKISDLETNDAAEVPNAALGQAVLYARTQRILYAENIEAELLSLDKDEEWDMKVFEAVKISGAENIIKELITFNARNEQDSYNTSVNNAVVSINIDRIVFEISGTKVPDIRKVLVDFNNVTLDDGLKKSINERVCEILLDFRNPERLKKHFIDPIIGDGLDLRHVDVDQRLADFNALDAIPSALKQRVSEWVCALVHEKSIQSLIGRFCDLDSEADETVFNEQVVADRTLPQSVKSEWSTWFRDFNLLRKQPLENSESSHKTVVIDFDGVIHHVIDVPSGDYGIGPRAYFEELEEVEALYSFDVKNTYETDTAAQSTVRITYPDHIAAVCKILTHQGHTVLLGSHRNNDATEQGVLMWKHLSKCFGSDRDFLCENVSKLISKGQDTGARDKNAMLKAAKKITGNEIVFVDDNAVYTDAACRQGHEVVTVDRKSVEVLDGVYPRSPADFTMPDKLSSLSFLGEVLYKTDITPDQLAASMKELGIESSIQGDINKIFGNVKEETQSYDEGIGSSIGTSDSLDDRGTKGPQAPGHTLQNNFANQAVVRKSEREILGLNPYTLLGSGKAPVVGNGKAPGVVSPPVVITVGGK